MLNYKNSIIYITIILAVIVSLFFVSNTIAQNQKEENYDIILTNIDIEKVNKIENLLKNLSIPYKIKEDSINIYSLSVESEYKAYTSIKLFEKLSEEQENTTDSQKSISNEFIFNNDVIDILIKDYCNKINKYKKTNDKFYESLFSESERALEYYISKQLYSIGNISDSKISIMYNDTFNFSMIIDTDRYFNESDIDIVKKFLINNVNGIYIENEKIYNNKIIFEGKFNWKLSDDIYDIPKIEYENNKNKKSYAVSGGGKASVEMNIKE